MLTLNDGRSELWQWDTGRTLAVDADCSQVHFSNKVFGRSIDVDVIDGAAIIPDILLQTDKDLNVWAFVGTAENGYTKISKTFKVNRRNKPADYVFTPTDQITLQTIQSQIGDLADLTTEAKDTLVAAINEAARTGGGGGGSTVELDTTLTQSGKAADAKATGDAIRSLSEEIANLQTGGLTTAQINALDGMFKVCAFTKDNVSAEYTAFKTAFGIADSGGETEVTLSSITASYSGGDVPVGTAVADLTGIVVTAHYSDGSQQNVTGYTLSGTIAEGENTVTVIYGGKMTEFVVVGVAESGGEVIMLSYIESDGNQFIDTEVIPTFELRYEVGYQMVVDENLGYNVYSDSNNIFGACQYASNDAGSYGFMSMYTSKTQAAIEFQSIANGINYWYNGNIPYFEQQIMHVVCSYVKNVDGTILQQVQAFTDEAHTNEPAHRAGTTTISPAAQESKIMPIVPIYLFKVNVASGSYYKDEKFPTFVGKISYFKVYDDVTGNLLHDFHAAKLNGAGGMYDTVTGEFHGNLGAGAFTLGEEVTDGYL